MIKRLFQFATIMYVVGTFTPPALGSIIPTQGTVSPTPPEQEYVATELAYFQNMIFSFADIALGETSAIMEETEFREAALEIASVRYSIDPQFQQYVDSLDRQGIIPQGLYALFNHPDTSCSAEPRLCDIVKKGIDTENTMMLNSYVDMIEIMALRFDAKYPELNQAPVLNRILDPCEFPIARALYTAHDDIRLQTRALWERGLLSDRMYGEVATPPQKPILEKIVTIPLY